MNFRNFSFVIPQRLAGMCHPGHGKQLEESLSFLKSKGITAIVTLTERSLSQRILQRHGFQHIHIPISDFSCPSLAQITTFVEFVESIISKDEAVAVHCQAGIGRTGTMLACYLVKDGYAPEESLFQIRNLRPGSVETKPQENIIYDYAKLLKSKP